jgi:hypothetical protein
MARSKFYDLIKNAKIEKDVEHVYTQGINLYFPGVDIEHTFACDALVDTKNKQGKLLKLIIEYKFDEDFQSRTMRAKVIAQVLFYMKRFELNGMILPNVAMVGDVNECFVFHTNDIISYLDEDIDWSTAPSQAHINNPDLVMKLAQDENINPFVFVVDENFSFKDVADKIYDLSANIQRYVHVTEHNIATIFEYFTNRVITNKKKVSANDLVAVFMGVITKNENYYKHPMKKNVLVTPLGDVKINGEGYDAFFSYFNRNYTPQEKMRFTEISDRLIEDTSRRKSGDFWTPTLLNDYAHDMMSKAFGEDWKEKYVVWDSCCGGKNMTRDYLFSELYCSTLFEAELDMSQNYNKEATSFQFDFLNDPLDKLPKGLLEALNNDKPIIFFINPPYATANNFGSSGTHKGGVAKTKINEMMLEDGIGSASQNLYAQFLYRIIQIKKQFNLTDCNIGLFCKPNYLSGPAYDKFRVAFFDNFSYTKGILFNASEFADVSDKWGINFTIWKNGKQEGRNDFIHLLLVNNGVEYVGDGFKYIYNIDGTISGSDWAKEPIKHLKNHDVVNVSSAIVIRPDSSDTRGKNFDGNFGYFLNAGNNVAMNGQKVALFTSAYGNGNGHGLSADNFTRCTSLFAARKLVVGNWINDKDEYMKPNTEHPLWQEFENDSIIYSLFNTSSNQSSLRQVEYKGKLWDIKNEFFWMSREEMMSLANENGNDHCYQDANVSSDRYVYNLLQGITLSEEAQAVLDKACELVRKTFKYRMMFDEDNENYQINNWDASFYQMKPLWKEYAKEDFEEFKVLYKKLADKMLPMVYEVGFLRK